MKFIILCSFLILSGCTGMEIASGLSTVKDIISEPPKIEVKTVPKKKDEFFDSSYNWNGTGTKEEVVEDVPGVIIEKTIKPEESENSKREEKNVRLPWPLFIIFLLSGMFYIINKIRIKQILRQIDDSN